MFLDLGGYVNVVPSTVMTISSASAIVLTAWVWFSNRDEAESKMPAGAR